MKSNQTQRPAQDERVKADIADWLKPQCQRLRYGRCTTLYCLRRGGYVGKGGPTDYSIATCEPYEIYNALYSSAVQPAASTPTGDAFNCDLSCARWVPYDENHRRYEPDKPCTCGAEAQGERKHDE